MDNQNPSTFLAKRFLERCILRATCLTLLCLVTGCPSKKKPPAPEKDPATLDIPLDDNVPDDPAAVPQAPDHLPALVDVRHLLIRYKGVKNVDQAKWSKEEALRRASRLVAAARKQGATFEQLAKRYSEDKPDERGVLHRVKPGEMDETFETAALQLGVGQVSDPIDTSFGYYVVKREASEEFSSAHILILFQGTRLAGPKFERTKKEAQALAEKVRRQVLEKEASFAVLAGRYSDSPSGRLRGGVLAPMGPASIPEGLEDYYAALKQLEEGSVSEVIETPFGFHLIQRLPLQRVLVRHVLIAYDGAALTPKTSRTSPQARDLATEILAKARTEGSDFALLARQYSDDQTSRDGLLPPFARGEMTPRFEQFAFALKPGELSPVVDTRFGYHVIKRLR